MNEMIVTGEKIQQLCDIYLGDNGDFNFNPLIGSQVDKHKNINDINDSYNNPFLIFCYSHLLDKLVKKIDFFSNNFILVTHNSDGEIKDNDCSRTILNNKLLIRWYGQNVCFYDEKLEIIPIGFANRQWVHGNLSLFDDKDFLNNLGVKTGNVYFNFNIATNINKRGECYDKLKSKLEWLGSVSPEDNLRRLSRYKFCVCPEGNGVDTHRLWECLYLRVVPIVLRTDFTRVLMRFNIPLVILDSWDELCEDKLDYGKYFFYDIKFKNLIDFQYYSSKIKNEKKKYLRI